MGSRSGVQAAVPNSMAKMSVARYPRLCKSKRLGERTAHCHDKEQVVAMLGKRYECKVRKKESTRQNPVQYGFRGYDKNVIAKSHDIVIMEYKKHGFDQSKRSGTKLSVLRELRSEMSQSLSVSGFRESMLESFKEYHLYTSVQWRSYVDTLSNDLRTNPMRLPRDPFFFLSGTAKKQRIKALKETGLCKFRSEKWH